MDDIDDLPKNAANYTALTPLWFLQRAALLHPTRPSLLHGALRFTWADTYRRCRRLASALSLAGIARASTVAVIAPNVPAAYEAHFGVPMAGAVVNPINIRLNAPAISFLLTHSRAAAVIVDQELLPLLKDSLKSVPGDPLVIVVADGTSSGGVDGVEYEEFLNSGDPEFAWSPPEDEWRSIALGYTSGTTSSPKGVVLHHRGAYLMSLSGAFAWGVAGDAEPVVYLWTLPMFHCNGWCFTWSLAAICATSICLRQVTPERIYAAIADAGVTHFCAVPVVLTALMNSPGAPRRLPRAVNVMTAGAAPTPALLEKMSARGFRVTHTYGLSETYGPSVVCAWKPEWDALPPAERSRLHARQGVRYVGLEGLDVVDMKTMEPVPADGRTAGEIVFRGNVVMKGYLRNPEANAEAFAGGWYHSGDVGVKHGDGYVEVKDRVKDVIISGGENVSSIEVEKAVSAHPAVLEAAVVARADERWEESPCAFVELKVGADVGAAGGEAAMAAEIMRFCKERLPGFWAPKSVVFGALPKTATGKVKKAELRARAKELGPVRHSKL